jgi:arylsulfatase A-like enzyme
LPPALHVDHWVADCTIRRLREHRDGSRNQPFLIWCSFSKPHAPLDPPYAYAAAYDPRVLPPPFGDPSLLETRHPGLARTRQTHALASLSPAAWQVIRAYYYGVMTFQDEQIGRVLAALAEMECAENTIVIYTADHGDLLGDFGTCFKSNFLRGSVQVPFIWRGPGLPVGERRRHLAGLQDILPTLAALAGTPLPEPVDGVDLSPALRSASASGRDLFFGTCNEAPAQTAMVFDGRWKYIYSQQGPTEELYDLEQDPAELQNLALTPDGMARLPDWRARLVAEARRFGDDRLLDGEGLAVAPLDRAALARLPVQGMGWRWA